MAANNNNSLFRRALIGLRDFLEYINEDPTSRGMETYFRQEQARERERQRRRVPDNPGARAYDLLRPPSREELEAMERRAEQLSRDMQRYRRGQQEFERGLRAEPPAPDNMEPVENVEIDPVPDNVDPGSIDEMIQRSEALARQARRFAAGRGRVGGGKKGSTEAKRRMAYVRSFRKKH